MSDVKKIPLRSEIETEYKWRLEDIFSSDETWEIAFNDIKRELPKLTLYEGKLGESSSTLLSALKLKNTIFLSLEKLYTYAHLRYDEDTTNTHYQGYYDRIISLNTEASSLTAYFLPELLSMNPKKLQSFINDNSELKLYQHLINKTISKRPYVLSQKEEALLAQASEVMKLPSTTFGILNNADLKFPAIIDEDGEEAEITHGRFIRFMESKNRQVRKDAFQSVYSTYNAFKNTFASTLNGVVKKQNFNARVRGYDSARHAALSNNYIPESVYDQLVSTVNDHLPLLHRYIDLRKRVLQVDKLHMYDLYTPLVEVTMKVTYPKAQELLLEALKPLGTEYTDILQEAYDNRWVDVYENKGKRSGAYSSGSYETNPYILMNWQDNINNLFTLAHEFGHSIHSYYTRKTQPYVYGDYTIFVAEVASTCNEALLNDYLLKNTNNKQKRLYLLNHQLESYRGTVFRQTMFAEFEHAIHQKAQSGQALTPDVFTKMYYELNQKYYGNQIVIDDEIGMEWARIPHFYYNYYVYQYATGFSAAAALSRKILEEGELAVEMYKGFLKAGSSNYPIEILKEAGVDMTSPKPIEQALKVFDEILTEMETLI